MAAPLMPKATAVWLVDNTSLTFDQIADYCGLHRLEVQGIADGEVAIGIQGLDPIANSQLTRDEIVRCEKDPSARLKMLKTRPAGAVQADQGAALHAGCQTPGQARRHRLAAASSPGIEGVANRETDRHHQDHDPGRQRTVSLEQPEHSPARPGAAGSLRAKRAERGGGTGEKERPNAWASRSPSRFNTKAQPTRAARAIRPRSAVHALFPVIALGARVQRYRQAVQRVIAVD